MLNLIKRDLLLLYQTNIYKWLVAIGIVVFLTLVSLYNLSSWYRLQEYTSFQANMTDVLFENFKGKGTGNEIPITWLTLQLYSVFLVGGYLLDDLQENGIYIITRSSRIKWWLSKIVSVILTIIFYYTLLFFVTFLVSCLFLDISFDWSIYAKHEILPLLKYQVSPTLLLSTMLGLLVASSIFFSLIHITLSMIIKPVYGYIIVTIFLFLSVFVSTFFSPSMHSIILRQDIFLNNSSTPLESYLFNFIPAIFFCLFGAIYFNRKDL